MKEAVGVAATVQAVNALSDQDVARITWLDIESGSDDLPGGARWLVNLDGSGEVLPLPSISIVPLMQPWFAGVANIRGTLFSVVDFSAWRGGEPTPRTAQARLLLIGQHSALLLRRTWGLQTGLVLVGEEEKSAVDAQAVQGKPFVTADKANGTAAWLGQRLSSPVRHVAPGDGAAPNPLPAQWTCLVSSALLAEPAFMEVMR